MVKIKSDEGPRIAVSWCNGNDGNTGKKRRKWVLAARGSGWWRGACRNEGKMVSASVVEGARAGDAGVWRRLIVLADGNGLRCTNQVVVVVVVVVMVTAMAFVK